MATQLHKGDEGKDFQQRDAAGIEEAIAKVKTQHPQKTRTLEVITVGGILAPDQVISLDINLL